MGAWGIDPAGLRGKLIAQFWARKLAAVRERDVREAFDRAERQFTKRAPPWPEFADLLRSVTGEQRQQAREARNELGPVTPAERREIAGQLSAEAVRRLQRNRTDRYGLWLRQLAETYEQNRLFGRCIGGDRRRRQGNGQQPDGLAVADGPLQRGLDRRCGDARSDAHD